MTSADTSGRVHLSVAEARALSERAMPGIGYEPDEARILADHVIDALILYHGVLAQHARWRAQVVAGGALPEIAATAPTSRE